ncbi:mechanosensitive ion channel family protein [Flavobacterium sp. MXW15]|uniref:Small-conductance mechanosensitive channel n=1 Tax=Xanthomonas chitinilytica TaxID=2989819 RepID=A0ABT3JRZ0_9XANT|nr:mechanosensitive ion channel family protein [Xanthomonas sp. H13-6]MCW4453694.1 mechanosensitive ion channel family protein [Flavobacterium sp. MXW15]MCW4471255.1 mechanosensitive ion channel family protein [Xanthomonas sp. H13-6]
MKQHLPVWMHEWIEVFQGGLSILLILVAAWLLRLLARRLLARLGTHYTLPLQLEVAARRLSNFVIWSTALVMILDRLGVSATVLWTAFTGFAAVGAVAFFAAWSVLSNIFCTLLIFTTRPFRIGDQVELLENGEKPGLKGRVIDINLIYTTLQEVGGPVEGTLMQIPNSLFFQRPTRRWRPTHAGSAEIIQGDG